MKYSIVIPCFNEAASLPSLTRRCLDVAEQKSHDLEFILVDNGSTDDTGTILNELLAEAKGCRSISLAQNQGYGAGILGGARSG